MESGATPTKTDELTTTCWSSNQDVLEMEAAQYAAREARAASRTAAHAMVQTWKHQILPAHRVDGNSDIPASDI